MNSDQWQRVETLYHAALEQEQDARVPFLTDTCSDEQVRLEVAALLNYDTRAKSFMEMPAFKQTAKALAADSDPEMSLAPKDIGPYRLLAPIGQGGMGQVYLALDSRLNRKVAIKLLPTALSSDPERARRFKQEARAASALSHPNIVTVFEVGKVNERHYIVSEFVEGQTLRERLAALPDSRLDPRDAITIGVQVTHALEAAHTAGVIHRDIKPENVMIRKDGLVKVLDFGLAKINSDTFPETNSQSQLLTRTGMVMGTAAYMSPEQARGQQIDHRADIFSLGAMLYESLSGQRPFTGETTSDVIAAVLIKEPEPITAVAPHVNQHVGAIVTRCLEKKPENRFQSAADLAFSLQDLTSLQTENVVSTNSVRQSVEKLHQSLKTHPKLSLVAAVMALIVLSVLAFQTIKLFSRVAGGPTVSFSFPLPTGWNFRTVDAPVVSPDGKRIVFSAFPASDREGTQSALWIRNVDSGETSKLHNTDGALAPFWSPDSRNVAFWQANKLNRLDVASGSVTTLSTVSPENQPIRSEVHGTWGTSNVLLFSHSWKLFRLSTQNGNSVPIDLAENETGRVNPHFLPDGRHYLYYSRSEEKEQDGVYVASLDSGERTLLVKNATAAWYSSGYLLFTRERQLYAQEFDPNSRQISGVASALPAQVGATSSGNTPVFSASESGVIAWRPLDNNVASGPPGAFTTQLTWFDNSGRRLSSLGAPGTYSGPSLSPDQQRVVVGKIDPRSRLRDLWIIDVASGASTQFTNDSVDEFNPVWSPDGNWIYYSAARNGTRTVFRKRVDGSGSAEPVTNVKDEDSLEDISPNGKFLIVNSRQRSDDEPDLVVISLTGTPRRIRLTENQYRDDQATFSPDGKWIAYHSQPPGSSGIYLASIRPDGQTSQERFQVTRGGNQPRWGPDGSKLFYLDGDKLVSVELKRGPDGITGENNMPLFEVKVESNTRRNHYIRSRDGRFLVVSETEALVAGSVAGQLNWTTALRNN
jgi:serine/threonine protein kinase